MKGLAILFLMLCRIVAAACLPTTGEKILVGDVAALIPAFAGLPSNLALGYAPEPGNVRRFTAVELISFARSHGIALENPPDICVSVPVTGALSKEVVLKAMQDALPVPAEINLLEWSQASVPVGKLSFPLDGLEPPQPYDPSVQLWKGWVSYSPTRRFRTWARVRILADCAEIVALRPLRNGDPISADAVHIEKTRGPLRAVSSLHSVEEVAGKTLLRSVRAGDRITAAMLAPAIVLRRGDPVKVEVINGPAHLVFSAVAEANAREGESVQLRNPASGKTFTARLDGPGKAVISFGNTQ